MSGARKKIQSECRDDESGGGGRDME